jgi:hypothetical protein
LDFALQEINLFAEILEIKTGHFGRDLRRGFPGRTRQEVQQRYEDENQRRRADEPREKPGSEVVRIIEATPRSEMNSAHLLTF